MRKILATAALGAGLVTASLGLTAPPASAVCNMALYELTGWCSPCSIVGIPYGIADHVTGDRYLPSLECAA